MEGGPLGSSDVIIGLLACPCVLTCVGDRKGLGMGWAFTRLLRALESNLPHSLHGTLSWCLPCPAIALPS